MEKGKKKRVGVTMARSYFYLFLSHRHAVLSRGTERNHKKILECSNIFQISLSFAVSVWSDISNQVRHFHQVPEPWWLGQVRYL
jgi:hypothetical protein